MDLKNSRKNSLIYIASSAAPVFDSQVVSLLAEIKKTNYFESIILLAGVKSKKKGNLKLESLSETNLNILFYLQYPNYSFFRKIQELEMSSVINNILSDNTIIHLRGETLARVIMGITRKTKHENIKILTDIRGAAIEELKSYSGKRSDFLKYLLKLYHYKKQLVNIGSNSDYISCVSDALLKKVMKETKIGSDKIGVNHCIAGSDFIYSYERRLSCRKQLSIKDEEVLFVFVTGGNGLYENTNEIIRKISSQGIKILNLSRIRIENENVINLFVPYSSIPDYLCAADIGIIWRNNDVVNNVSSPVKFSEYACCGLPVIANNGVHLINEYVNETGYGKIILSLNEINETMISHLVKLDRNIISQKARKIYSSEAIVQNYIRVYNRLLNN